MLVLGDQLDADAAAFDGFDPQQDAVWMAEVAQESNHVWSSQQRLVMFLSAMRHFALALEGLGRPLHYRRLGPDVLTKRSEPYLSDSAATSSTAGAGRFIDDEYELWRSFTSVWKIKSVIHRLFYSKNANKPHQGLVVTSRNFPDLPLRSIEDPPANGLDS